MIYIYGIIRNGCAPELDQYTGIGSPPAHVQAIPTEDYDFVVSEVEQPGTLTPDDVITHANVLNKLFDSTEVIPVKFGTVVPGVSNLPDLIRSNRKTLKDVFKQLQGRVEVGLKIYWQPESLKTRIQEHFDIDRAKREMTENPESTYAWEIEIGQMAEQVIEQWRQTLIQTIERVLAPMADDMVIGNMISIYMLCNVSFLIARNKGPAFQTQVFKLEEKFGRDVQIHYVDNLPPFNFIDLQLGGAS